MSRKKEKILEPIFKDINLDDYDIMGFSVLYQYEKAIDCNWKCSLCKGEMGDSIKIIIGLNMDSYRNRERSVVSVISEVIVTNHSCWVCFDCLKRPENSKLYNKLKEEIMKRLFNKKFKGEEIKIESPLLDI